MTKLPDAKLPDVFSVPLKQLVESPFNPRKHYDEKALGELAENLKQFGILQPLVVRPQRIGPAEVPDKFELIFGHRRLRAAQLAKLETVPVRVRDCTDTEASILQVTENDQREDLTALERAEGYLTLHKKHGLSVDDIAKKVGKSRSAVYEAIKLCDLAKPVKSALAAGELSPACAGLISRVAPALQAKVLEEAERRTQQGDPLSFRELNEVIHRDFMLNLKDAAFDTKSADLVKAAGSCVGCPKRTGSQPDFFQAKSPDVCTDKGCYSSKVDAHLVLEEKKGKKVLSPTQAKEVFQHGHDHVGYNSGYVAADEKEYGSKKTAGEKVKPEDIVLAKAPSGMLVQLVPKAALPKPASSASDTKYAEQQRHFREEQQVRKETNKRVDAARIELLEKKLGGKGIPDAVWRKLALTLAEEWNAGDVAVSRGWEQGWKKNEVPKLGIGAAVIFCFQVIGHDSALSEAFNIDEKKLEQEAKAEVKAELKEKKAAKKKPAKKAVKK